MAKLDRNGYAPSLLSDGDGICYFCGATDTVRHEIFAGGANRPISKENGFWVTLCVRHHGIVHTNEDFAEKYLKRPCMEKYLETHTRAEWYKLIGRFYDE